MKITFILLSLVSLHAIRTSEAVRLDTNIDIESRAEEEGGHDSLAQVSTGAETEIIPPSMITDVIKAIKGPPPAPGGPVD